MSAAADRAPLFSAPQEEIGPPRKKGERESERERVEKERKKCPRNEVKGGPSGWGGIFFSFFFFKLELKFVLGLHGNSTGKKAFYVGKKGHRRAPMHRKLLTGPFSLNPALSVIQLGPTILYRVSRKEKKPQSLAGVGGGDFINFQEQEKSWKNNVHF